jgi:hypothetical protein
VVSVVDQPSIQLVAFSIGGFFRAIGSFFGSFFQAEVNVVENLQRIVDNFDRGKTDIEDGIERIKNFKFEPAWNTRVINVPAAIDHVKALYDDLFGDFRDRVATIIDPFKQLSLIFTAEHEDPQAPSGLAKTVVKIDELATMIQQVADASEEALRFVEAIDNVIINLESLDALFLQQGNPRRIVHDETARIRVGHLH